MKNFNEMNEQDIINTLKEISKRYGVTYLRVGYSRERHNNTIMIVLNSGSDDNKTVRSIINGIFLGLNDVEGNPLINSSNYDDAICPSVCVYDSRFTEGIKLWIKHTERVGCITWLEV